MTDEFQENDVVVLLVDIPTVRLRRGDVGNVVHVFSPTKVSPGGLLLEFVKEGVVTQTDIDNMADIVKLDFQRERTLEEWAGASRIFALVFTDIVDSTALANQSGDESWIELLRKHFAQARLLMSKHDHHEIKIIGDSFMVVFRSALDALDFAVALHEHTGDEQITIRVGIHVGSPRVIGNDVFGKMVNYTKRVESAEENKGGIRLSDAAMTLINDERAQRHARLEFTRRQVPFKGYPSPETIWVVSDRFAAFKPPREFIFGQP